MSESKHLKIALVGCGNIAKVHARLLLKFCEKADLALCDRDEVRLSALAKETGIVHVFTDLDVLLTRFKPDIVHVLTPPLTHKAVALQCLAKGTHVLVEKPLCVSSQDAQEIQNFADSQGRKVCVSHMRSFDPMILKVKEIMARENFGNLVNVSVGYSYDYLQRAQFDPASRWINHLPGGVFFDLMPHVLCPLKDFLPDLRLESKNILTNEEGLITDLHCFFSSGKASGRLHMSLQTLPLKNEVEFECANGSIKVDFRNFLIIKRRFRGLPNAIERIVGNLSVGRQYLFGSITSVFYFLSGRLDPYAGIETIIREFIAAVQSGKAIPIPVSRARDLLLITEQIFDQNISETPKTLQKQTLKESDILVTGATGFIGRHLVNRLIRKGHKVRVFSHRNIKPERLKELFGGDVDFYQGEIYSAANVEEACTGVKTVFHLAAAMAGDRNYFLDTTVTGTKNVIKAIERHGIDNLIYISTLNVYHAELYKNGATVDENFPYEACPEKRGAYSHAKLTAEKELRAFCQTHPNFNCCIFRPGLVYGQGGKTLFNDVAIAKGRWAMMMGLGGRKLPLVYIENLIDALMLGFDKIRSIRQDIFNVVDPDYPNQNQYLRAYRTMTANKLTAIRIPLFCFYAGFGLLDFIFGGLLKKPKHLVYKLKSSTKSVYFSTQRIEALGWRPVVKFEEGLSRALNAEIKRS